MDMVWSNLLIIGIVILGKYLINSINFKCDTNNIQSNEKLHKPNPMVEETFEDSHQALKLEIVNFQLHADLGSILRYKPLNTITVSNANVHDTVISGKYYNYHFCLN